MLWRSRQDCRSFVCTPHFAEIPRYVLRNGTPVVTWCRSHHLVPVAVTLICLKHRSKWMSGGIDPGICHICNKRKTVSNQLHTPASLARVKGLSIESSVCSSAGMEIIKRKPHASDVNQTPVVKSVASHYADWAIPTYMCTFFSTGIYSSATHLSYHMKFILS
jgi:hypothetical protein